MKTALILSEIPIHDDALVADIDAEFDEMNRDRIAARQRLEQEALLLDVDWLVSDLLEEVTIRMSREALEILARAHPRVRDHVRDRVRDR